jgi:hypothetical protein
MSRAPGYLLRGRHFLGPPGLFPAEFSSSAGPLADGGEALYTSRELLRLEISALRLEA